MRPKIGESVPQLFVEDELGQPLRAGFDRVLLARASLVVPLSDLGANLSEPILSSVREGALYQPRYGIGGHICHQLFLLPLVQVTDAQSKKLVTSAMQLSICIFFYK